MWHKPAELTSYQSEGYEIAAASGSFGLDATRALELWQGSPSHHAVILNQGQWGEPWAVMGAFVEGNYATAWFGRAPDGLH